MSRGRTPYHKMPSLLSAAKPFEGHSMSAYTGRYGEFDGLYFVDSYSTTIALWAPHHGPYGTLYLNTGKYSVTTSQHQNLAAAWVGNPRKLHAIVDCHDESDLYRTFRILDKEEVNA